MRVIKAALLVVSLAATAYGQSITERGDHALGAYQYDLDAELPGFADNQLPTVPPQGAPGMNEFKQKSVAKAFAYSLIIPGAGQFYTGSKLKGFIFLGVEALGWVAYISYNSSGDDKTAEYEAFADTYWHEKPYWDSLWTKRQVEKWHDHEEFPHHLPWTINENGDTVADLNHEYYENIGKYDQFVWGWDDLQQYKPTVDPVNPELSYSSRQRMDYELMREDANAQYDHARAAGIVLIANHLVSALEAAFSAKRYNNRAEHAARFDVKVNMVNLEDTPTPWVRVAYRF